jgi:hypothetical protein
MCSILECSILEVPYSRGAFLFAPVVTQTLAQQIFALIAADFGIFF